MKDSISQKTRLHLRKVLVHTYCLYKLHFLIIENELLFDLNVKKRNFKSFVTVHANIFFNLVYMYIGTFIEGHYCKKPFILCVEFIFCIVYSIERRKKSTLGYSMARSKIGRLQLFSWKCFFKLINLNYEQWLIRLNHAGSQHRHRY